MPRGDALLCFSQPILVPLITFQLNDDEAMQAVGLYLCPDLENPQKLDTGLGIRVMTPNHYAVTSW